MSVIVDLTIPSETFELGRILTVEDSTHVTLETMVPLGGRPTPFVRIQNDARSSFEQSVREHPSVTDIHEVNSHGSETLYALAWEPSGGTLFRTILDMEVALLGAEGTADSWALDLRFPTHETLSEFQAYCLEHALEVTIERIYNPTKPDAGPWYGLTTPQREALTYAVEAGYYSLPREASTIDLAEAFGISDQAVTERLRRGITTLVTNTLLATEADA